MVSAGGNAYAYDDNGNMVSGAGRRLAWTSFDKPRRIVDGATDTVFDYGPDRERTVQTRVQGAATTTIVYVAGLFERVAKTGEATRSVHYVFAGSARIAIRTTDDAPTPADTLRYLHRDHLGSVDTVTDAAGAVVERLSYDAFGKRRVAAGEAAWTDSALAIAAVETPRGFTGHEHLDDFQLVHMNGRIQDPHLGRFISADPFVQFPESTQGLNRYAYAANNPLSFTDPSGYFYDNYWWDDYGGYGYGGYGYGGYGGSYQDPFGGPVGWTPGNFAAAPHCGSGVPGCVAGGNAGTLGSAAEWAMPDFSRPGGLDSTVAHGRVGGGPEDEFSGVDMYGFGPWAIDPAATVEARIAASAAIGGTASKLGGGKFANGAATGGYGRLYNAQATADSLPRPADLEGIGKQGVGGARWLIGRLFWPLSLLIPRELGDKGYFYHYTSDKNSRLIKESGTIIPNSDGYIYVTDRIYWSGNEAQSKLALLHTPAGFFRIPANDVEPIERHGRVQSILHPRTGEILQPGGGYEYIVKQSITIMNSQWIEIRK